jgi:hypothetical protein
VRVRVHIDGLGMNPMRRLAGPVPHLANLQWAVDARWRFGDVESVDGVTALTQGNENPLPYPLEVRLCGLGAARFGRLPSWDTSACAIHLGSSGVSKQSTSSSCGVPTRW